MNQDQCSSIFPSDVYFIYLQDVVPEETILHYVVRMRDINALEQILEWVDLSFINSLDGESRSPVHIAIEEDLESIVQLFLSTVKDLMTEDQYYLHYAIAKGNINIVKLLAEHFSVLTKNQDNMTAFCMAINEDKFEILDYLLNLPSSINMNSSIYEHCALFYVAIIAGNIEIVKTYLESKFPIDAPLQSNADGWEILNQHSGFSPLHLAVKFLRLNIVELLLDQGADIMKQNGTGSSALQIAFETKTRGIWKTCLDIEINNRIIDRLLNDIIQKEALILTKSTKISFLHAACSRDRPEVIEKCLKKRYITKKYLKKCDNLRFSPLHYAAKYSCHKVAKILLRYRVNVNQKDDKYRTPLHIASEKRSTEFIEILMQYKADPNLKDCHGNTPIHLAFNTRNYAILDILLKNKTIVKPNVTDAVGISHFHIACTRNNVKLIRAFIDAGTPVDLQVPIDSTIKYQKFNKDLDWRGCVPLHFAIAFNRLKIVKLLLLHGADLRIQDAKGFYPIHTACQQIYTKIEELIMDSWMKYLINSSIETLGWIPVHWKGQPHSNITCDDGTTNEPSDSYPRKFPTISSQLELFKTEAINIIDWTANRIEQRKIIKLLFKKGADINVLDNFGNAPLYYIFNFDIHEIIHILCKKFRLDKKLGTAIVRTLLREMYYRRTCFLNLIFEFGVYINVDKSYNNTSILHYICQKNEFFDEKSLAMVKYFLERNADPDATDRLNRTALHVAQESMDLHEYLENFNNQGDKKNFSLQMLSELSIENKAYFRIIDVLLRYNARVDFRDGEGQTPLLSACLSKNLIVIWTLLNHGADVNAKIIKNNDLQTALYYFYKQHVKKLARNGTIKNDVLIITRLLVTHVEILQAVGLYVGEKVENPTLQLNRYLATTEWNDEDSALTASLQSQVEQLKNCKIHDKISLYHVLFMNEQNVAKDEGIIEQLKKILSSKGSYMDAFPDYKKLIEQKYNVAVERKRLLSEAKKTLNRLLRSSNFPEVCSEMIFMELKNFEIAYFIKAFWVYNK